MVTRLVLAFPEQGPTHPTEAVDRPARTRNDAAQLFLVICRDCFKRGAVLWILRHDPTLGSVPRWVSPPSGRSRRNDAMSVVQVATRKMRGRAALDPRGEIDVDAYPVDGDRDLGWAYTGIVGRATAGRLLEIVPE